MASLVPTNRPQPRLPDSTAGRPESAYMAEVAAGRELAAVARRR